MNNLITTLALVVSFSLAGAASAQIYESTDAEGVPEFSDEPAVGSQEIELPATNVASPVEAQPEPRPQSPEQAPAAATIGGGAGGYESEEGEEPGYIYYGGGDDDELGPRAQRREDAARVENRLPHEMDSEAGREAARQVEVARPDGAPEARHPAETGAAHHPGGRR